MTIWDVFVLVVATGALVGAGAAIAACLRLGSFAELVVGTYLIGWGWLVVLAFALSGFSAVTQVWLLVGALIVFVGSSAVWVLRGRPPAPRPPSVAVRVVLRDPLVLGMVVIAALAISYTGILAVGVAPNDWDALAYHLPRAAFWKQEHAIGLIAHANDPRLDVNPPIGEIGDLFVLTLSQSDRFVNALQFVALLASATAVYATARRLGLDARGGAFGALAFMLLPLPLLQASSALTDLLVASFLVAATCFVLSTSPPSLALGGLALALAVGTKFTGPLALPVIGAVALLGPARRRVVWLAVAGISGVALGSFWYLVNLAETGALEGNLGQSGPQTVNWIGWRARQYLLGELQFPGAHGGVVEVLVAGLVLIACSIVLARRGSHWARWLLLGGLVTAVLPQLALAARWAIEHSGAEVPTFQSAPDTALSWYGPVPVLLVPVAFVLVVIAVRRGRLPVVASVLAAGPIVASVTLLLLSYDPWRGRFFAYSFALSAATWGIVLRCRALAVAVVALTGTTAVLTLGHYVTKPSGFRVLDERSAALSAPRVEQQLVLRPHDGGASAIRLVSQYTAPDSHVVLAVTGDEYIAPYFGPSYRRHVIFIDRRKPLPREASWVVASSELKLDPCVWSDTYLVAGWHIYQRTGACPKP